MRESGESSSYNEAGAVFGLGLESGGEGGAGGAGVWGLDLQWEDGVR